MYHDLPSFMYIINSNSLEKLQSTTSSVILYRKVYRKCTITEPVVVKEKKPTSKIASSLAAVYLAVSL